MLDEKILEQQIFWRILFSSKITYLTIPSLRLFLFLCLLFTVCLSPTVWFPFSLSPYLFVCLYQYAFQSWLTTRLWIQKCSYQITKKLRSFILLNSEVSLKCDQIQNNDCKQIGQTWSWSWDWALSSTNLWPICWTKVYA